MRRFELTDGQYQRIAGLLPGEPSDPGATARDDRLFVDATLRIARTGAPWPDLPGRLGECDTAHRRFDRWAGSGALGRVMGAIGGDSELESPLIDPTLIRAHHHAAGAVKGGLNADRALGRSRGGSGTGVHIAVDASGNPVRLIPTGGQAADVTRGEALIAGIEAERVIAEEGYGSNEPVGAIGASGAVAVIPPRSNRKEEREYDRPLYKDRDLVERPIGRVGQCRRVATRYERTARNSLASWQLASIMVLPA